jgi:HD superfamily phosphohydrolase
MMNVDSPACKDLATASRFAHTIGVCHLSEELSTRRRLSRADADVLLSAAVLHDMGIPPFGHLIEQMIDEVDPPFDHEHLARQIVEGTYAPENKYHQIFMGRSLQLGNVLDKHGVDRERVFGLLADRRVPSAIAGALDMDNLDNVLRMASLLGLGNHQRLAYELVGAFRLGCGGGIEISDSALPQVEEWLRLRNLCYRIMMFNEEGIAYAALMHDLAKRAVVHGIVGKRNWFLTDSELLQRLLRDRRTKALAEQLMSSTRYRTLAAAYVDFDPADGAALAGARRELFLEEVRSRAGIKDQDSLAVFAWYEFAKVSRTVELRSSWGMKPVGGTSSSCLVALIQKKAMPNRLEADVAATCRRWLEVVEECGLLFARVRTVAWLSAIAHMGLRVGSNGEEKQLALL